MLYSLLIAVILLSLLMPFVGIYCFVKGYNLMAKKEGEPFIQTPVKHTKISKKDEKKLSQIYANIDSYDGTSIGQKEID